MPNSRNAVRCAGVALPKNAAMSHDKPNNSAVFISSTRKYSFCDNSKFRRCRVCKISPEQTVFVADATARQISGDGQFAAPDLRLVHHIVMHQRSEMHHLDDRGYGDMGVVDLAERVGGERHE